MNGRKAPRLPLLLLSVALPACAGRRAGGAMEPEPRPPPAAADDSVVFTATEDLATRTDLYLARTAGGGAVEVSGPMAPGGSLAGVAWSPDGSRLAYRADQRVDGRFELFLAAPEGGPENLDVSGPLADGGDVFAFSTP